MDWSEIATGQGVVICEPNYSQPLPSIKNPGIEYALHQYPNCGDIWLFRRHIGRKGWNPMRQATAAEIRAFSAVLL